MAKKQNERSSTETATNTLLWPTTDQPIPPDPLVSVYFTGLCGFCYRSPNCEVGFHRGDGKHKLMIKIYEKPGCCDITPDLPDKIDEMTIEILSKASKVDFYEKDPFTRNRDENDRNDFRWLLDLDAAPFYHEKVDKVSRAFKTKLTVRHGRFYTHSITNSKFARVNVGDLLDTLPLNQVAAVMAAAIEVQAGDHVAFSINGKLVKEFHPGQGKTYEVDFLNECEDNGKPCEFHPADAAEEKRNDFHFMRKVLKLKTKRTKYGLLITNNAGMEPPGPPCDTFARLNDEAPCMGTGFGQTDGFP